MAGAQRCTVHVRDAPEEPGKGPALNWLMGKLGADSFDAVAIIDADTIVAPDFLYAMDEALPLGCGRGTGCYLVREPDASPATTFRYAALALPAPSSAARPSAPGCVVRSLRKRHGVCSIGRGGSVVVGAPCGGCRIPDGTPARRPSRRVRARAVVLAEMPTTLDRAESQNRRWERGRIELAVRYVPRLLRRFVTGPDRLAVGDAVLDHLTPPISALVVAEAATALVGVGGAMLGSRTLARVHARGAVRSLGGRGARRGWPVVGRGTALELSTTTVGASSGSLEVRCVVVRVASGRTRRMGPDGTQRFGRAVVRPSTRSLLGVPIAHVTMEDTLAIVESMVREGRQRGTTSQIATVNVDFLVNALEDEHLAGILRDANCASPTACRSSGGWRVSERRSRSGSPDPISCRSCSSVRCRSAGGSTCSARPSMLHDAPPASSPSGIRRRK